MGTKDLLVLAGDAAALLEHHGFVACGRRENGLTRIEFWGREGDVYRYPLAGTEQTVEEIVAGCLVMAGRRTDTRRGMTTALS